MTSLDYIRLTNAIQWLMKALWVVFLFLKVAGLIDWSWWWVTAPMWGYLPLMIVLGLLGSVLLREERRTGSQD